MSETVHELVDRGVGSASDELVRLGERRGYTVGAVGPGTFRFERATRPVWATALAIVTMPLLGLGLLVLRVRNHESAVVTVFEDRSGVKVRIVGEIDDDIVTCLSSPPQSPDTAGASESPSPPRVERLQPPDRSASSPGRLITAPPSVTEASPSARVDPSVTLDGVDEVAATVARPRRRPEPQGGNRSTGWRIVLPDGSSHSVSTAVVVGRDPAVGGGEVKLAIDHMSLSKTHLRLDPSADGVRVTDLHSTNGSTTPVAGVDVDLEPGVAVLVPQGGVVIAGQVRMVIEGESA